MAPACGRRASLMRRCWRAVARAAGRHLGPGGNGPQGPRQPLRRSAGHTCLAIAGPAQRILTLRTGSGDRQANMRAFAARALTLMGEALDEAGRSPMITRRGFVAATASVDRWRPGRRASRPRPGVAHTLRPPRRALPAWRRHRRGRPHHRAAAVGDLGPAARDREPRRRRQQYRLRSRRARGPGRLHDPVRLAAARDQPLHLFLAGLRSRSPTSRRLRCLCRFPNLMAVPNASPATSVAEFIAHAKRIPASPSRLRGSARRRTCAASCSSAWPASR